MKKTVIQTLAWFAAVAAAFGLASVAPTESTVMGKMPALTVKQLDQHTVMLPEDLPSSRTLALVAFNKGHRDEIQSWIDGLDLHNDKSISWVRMPVMNDPRSDAVRVDMESRLVARHINTPDSGRLMPVFTDRDAFVRATGMTNTDHAWVLVLGRDGQVLARVEGQFDQDKAQALRETLQPSSFAF